MRFRRPTRQERNNAKVLKIESWNKKFAWLPVRLTSDKNEIRWLENVLRKGRASVRDGLFSKRVVGYNWIYAESTLDVLRLPDELDEERE